MAGNSLAEALVFGRRAAKAIAGQRPGRSKVAPPAPELVPADIAVEEEWTRLRKVATASIGIERTPEGMARAGTELEDLALLPLSSDRTVLELRSAAIMVRLIARAALLRTESRGGHHRRDKPDPDPAWAGVRLRLART